MKNKHQNKNIKIAIIFFIILMFILIFLKLYDLTNLDKIAQKQMDELFSKIEKNTSVNVTKYYIYGTNLNIEGNIGIINFSGIKIDSVSIILKNLDGEELRNKNRIFLFR